MDVSRMPKLAKVGVEGSNPFARSKTYSLNATPGKASGYSVGSAFGHRIMTRWLRYLLAR